MIGLICTYFIGKYFYSLALEYGRNTFLIVLLGLISFYVGSIIIGGVIYYFWMGKYLFSGSDLFFHIPYQGILKIPFGIAFACLVHYLLEVIWKKNQENIDKEINDIGKNE